MDKDLFDQQYIRSRPAQLESVDVDRSQSRVKGYRSSNITNWTKYNERTTKKKEEYVHLKKKEVTNKKLIELYLI